MRKYFWIIFLSLMLTGCFGTVNTILTGNRDLYININPRRYKLPYDSLIHKTETAITNLNWEVLSKDQEEQFIDIPAFTKISAAIPSSQIINGDLFFVKVSSINPSQTQIEIKTEKSDKPTGEYYRASLAKFYLKLDSLISDSVSR